MNSTVFNAADSGQHKMDPMAQATAAFDRLDLHDGGGVQYVSVGNGQFIPATGGPNMNPSGMLANGVMGAGPMGAGVMAVGMNASMNPTMGGMQPLSPVSMGAPIGMLSPMMAGMGAGHMADASGRIRRDIAVPNDKVGLVIGRGGETIRSLQINTGCRIHIAQDSPMYDSQRQVTLEGSQQEIDMAEEEIMRILSSRGANRPPRGPGFGGAPGGQGKEEAIIEIPNNMVGLIIGRGGETIKMLQIKTGASIQVTRDSERDTSSNMRTVRLWGAPEQIEYMKSEIEKMVFGPMRGLPGGMGGQAQVMVISIPSDCVGTVIGKQGETIKMLQYRTGCRIQISKDDRGGHTREVSLTGDENQLRIAQQQISLLCAQRGSGMASRDGGGNMGAMTGMAAQMMAPTGMAGMPPQMTGWRVPQMGQMSLPQYTQAGPSYGYSSPVVPYGMAGFMPFQGI
eukprot:g32357.t1